eukprot:symbB.v1.2.006263.t1/scaffold368.1/size218619/6
MAWARPKRTPEDGVAKARPKGMAAKRIQQAGRVATAPAPIERRNGGQIPRVSRPVEASTTPSVPVIHGTLATEALFGQNPFLGVECVSGPPPATVEEVVGVDASHRSPSTPLAWQEEETLLEEKSLSPIGQTSSPKAFTSPASPPTLASSHIYRATMSAQEPVVPEEVKIKNLDTGEMQDVQEMFSDVWQETSRVPWAKLWHDYRRSTEQLFEASMTGKINVLRSLLNEKSEEEVYQLSTEVHGLYGRTPLHVAAAAGQVDAAQALISLGANVNAQTDAGFTALHLACRHGQTDFVEFLLQIGADVTLQADQGETVLHLAAQHGKAELVTLLLGYAPDLYHVRNHYGQRPKDVSLDATTALAFQPEGSMMSSTASSSTGSSVADPLDGYGGRQLFGHVLLRNSRHDAVRRLLQDDLHRTGKAFASQWERRGRPRRPSKRFTKLQDRSETDSNRGAVGPQSFRILALLGRGSFGEVFQVAQKSTGQLFAMKVLRKNKIIGRNLMRYALTERNLLSYIRHPFIVRLHHAFQTPSCLVLHGSTPPRCYWPWNIFMKEMWSIVI